jgi:hypothetical protein
VQKAMSVRGRDYTSALKVDHEKRRARASRGGVFF